MGWICCGTPKSKTLVPSAGTAIHSAIQFLGVSVIQNLWMGGSWENSSIDQITLLRVIPTMTFIHLLLANLLAFYLANILALYLAYLLAFYLTFYLAFCLAYLLAFYLAYLRTFYLAYLLALYLAYLIAFYLAYLLASYLTFYLAYLLAFYLAFEVQRCALSSEGPRLRSSGAH